MQEAELRSHFPPEVFFNLRELKSVHGDYRRRGLYRTILECTIAYTRALGYDSIGSEHAFCNNPVIIAKLRAGFDIYAFELDPAAGPSLILRYFHNPEHRAAYEVRCGYASLTLAHAPFASV